MRSAAFFLAGMAFGSPAFAAGINSHAYSCPDLHALIARNGFVFIGNPDFQDFVVSDAMGCSDSDRPQPRSVPTSDNPQCLVNYCIPAGGAGMGGGGGGGGM